MVITHDSPRPFWGPDLRASEPRTTLFISRGDGRRGGRDRDRGARLERGQRTRFGRVVREGAFRPLLVRDAGLLRHESADPLAVRGLQSEEFRKIPPRRPGELLGREGFPGAEEGRFHDGPRVHGTASGVPIGFGPRTGIASSSSVGRSTSMERRFTKISPYG